MIATALERWPDDARYVTVSPASHRVFVKDFGDSGAKSDRTLLILHGFPESSFSFHKVIAGLQNEFDRIVIIDMLGYGFSDKPNIGYSYSLIEQADVALQVWRALGIQGGHALAHDMGTSVLTELVARQVGELLPAWFARGFHSYTFTNGSMVLKYAKLRLIQKLLLTRYGSRVSRMTHYRAFAASVRSAHGVPANSEHALDEQDIRSLWGQAKEQEGHHKSHLTIRYLLDRRRFEQSRWLPALDAAEDKTPIHICWGDADAVASVQMAYHLKNSVCPRAKLSIMPGVGHFGQLASPGVWLDATRSFFASLD